MPNAITADPSAQARIERAFAEICRGIPDRQALSIYAQTDPIPVGEALAEDRHRVELACEQDRSYGREDLAPVRRRLLSAQTQSVVHAAGSEQPAVAARWWLAVPHQPQAEDVRTRFRHALSARRAHTSWRSHQRAAAESLRQSEQVQAQLAAVGIEPWPLDGVQTLACLWERFHPAARSLPNLDTLDDATALAGATTSQDAAIRRHRILEAIFSGPEPAGIDASDSRWLRHFDGTLEEILHLGTPPIHTTLWWLMHLLSAPLPVTVAVHIRVGSRAQVRARQRRRWKRLSAAVDYKHRRAQLIGSEEHEALAEAELLDAELAGEIGATVYRVSISVAIRDPRGEPEAFDQLVKTDGPGIPGAHRRASRARTLAGPARTDLDDPARA